MLGRGRLGIKFGAFLHAVGFIKAAEITQGSCGLLRLTEPTRTLETESSRFAPQAAGGGLAGMLAQVLRHISLLLRSRGALPASLPRVLTYFVGIWAPALLWPSLHSTARRVFHSG